MTIDPHTPGVTPDVFKPVQGEPEPDLDLSDPDVDDPLPTPADVQKPLLETPEE